MALIRVDNPVYPPRLVSEPRVSVTIIREAGQRVYRHQTIIGTTSFGSPVAESCSCTGQIGLHETAIETRLRAKRDWIAKIDLRAGGE